MLNFVHHVKTKATRLLLRVAQGMHRWRALATAFASTRRCFQLDWTFEMGQRA